ncbi:HAD family hydrolase [Amycolatopsis sp. NPDC101161]|uniref:HAD family hydrolase n=1 Tax=Amycolatopsis sp. NPDC101161 TaxID=3363940 RepID=UPI003813FC99
MSFEQGLLQVLAESAAVIYDFDGPICGVFAGLPAEGVARQLELTIGVQVGTDDPLEVLRYAHQLGSTAVEAVERQLIAAELLAVETASLTRGGLTSMCSLAARGKATGILSNNSFEAVSKFMQKAVVDQWRGPIIGRPFGRPALMKPNPYGLDLMLSQLEVRGADAVFIGDSTSDIEVAKSRGVCSVGLANKPGKREMLVEAGAEFVVDNMVELAG